MKIMLQSRAALSGEQELFDFQNSMLKQYENWKLEVDSNNSSVMVNYAKFTKSFDSCYHVCYLLADIRPADG